MKVVDLIDCNRREWRRDILEGEVDTEDLELILKISLTTVDKPDVLIWHYTKSGVYTVKSGYHVAMDQKLMVWNRGSSSSTYQAVWSFIWKLKVPPKTKLFLWRACKGILPVRQNVNGRGVVCETSCPRCGWTNETVVHALLLCPVVVAVWFGSPLGLRYDDFHGNYFFEWVMSLASLLDMEQMGLVATIAAIIWEQRNAVVHGKKITFPQVLVAQNISRLVDFLEAQIVGDHTRVQLRSMNNKWVKPPFSVFKLNSDAFIKGNGFIGIGFVIRNHSGKVVGLVWIE